MEKMKDGATKIKVGKLELWTAPFGEKKATISAHDDGMKEVLLQLHQKMPNAFELMVDEADFCEEDIEGIFSLIVDPENVTINVIPGSGKLGFTVCRECDGDCDNCSECDKNQEPDYEVIDHEDGEVY